MSEDKTTLREALRAAKGLRIEARPPEQSALSRTLNQYAREQVNRSKTVLPLDHPALTGRDRQ